MAASSGLGIERKGQCCGGQSTARGWKFLTQQTDEAKQKREQIVRRILQDFDLEETKTKYRSAHAYSVRREGKRLADFEFRSELFRLMGTDKIRLADRGWSHTLQQKLREDYYRRLEKQEDRLAGAEKERMYRLLVEGIVRDNTSAHTDVISKAARKSLFAPKSVAASGGKDSRQRHGSARRDAGDASSKMFATISARHQQCVYHPLKRVESYLREVEEKSASVSDTKLAPAVTIPVEMSAADQEVRQQQFAERRKKRFSRLPFHLRRLYDEETVEGLYSLAGLLVPVDNQTARDVTKDSMQVNVGYV